MNPRIPSQKSYAVAVSLAAVFGVLGVHHFYLGRWIEGTFDLGLSLLGFYFYLNGHLMVAMLALGVDYLHTFIITIMLLTGSSKDGKGHVVCFPGQVL